MGLEAWNGNVGHSCIFYSFTVSDRSPSNSNSTGRDSKVTAALNIDVYEYRRDIIN